MRAIVVHEPGGPEVLQIEEKPDPEPTDGRVLIRVRAFGLNRAELITRSGGSGSAVPFPRVIGIECVGEVLDTGGDLALREGQPVAALMGGMGREFDGGYEEKASIPADSVMPIETSLPWEQFGALPETFGTAWGIVVQTLGLQAGQTILIRGGTSSVGMAAVTMARSAGATVLATTRQERKRQALTDAGADEVLIDDGSIADQARAAAPDGVDVALELVGPPALPDTAATLKPRGVVCIAGYLSDVWDVDAVRSQLPEHVRLTSFGSNVLTRGCFGPALQRIVEHVEDGRYRHGLAKVYDFDEIVDAHRAMEANEFTGKVVVRVP
jgi:NADPH:quinone reductase-like Zn-dependent oxidoreductase